VRHHCGTVLNTFIMLNRLQRSLSSSSLTLVGVKTGPKAADADDVPEEAGSWHYLVVDADGIRPRREPRYSKDTKMDRAERFKEGTTVEVSRRRRLGWTRWLGLPAGGGWLFDISPKDNMVRMVEVEFHAGSWQYQVCCDVMPVLPRITLSSSADTGRGVMTLTFSETVTVVERIRPLNSKGSFLRLADGRGYVLDFAKGRQQMQRILPADGSAEGDGAVEQLPPGMAGSPTAFMHGGAQAPMQSITSMAPMPSFGSSTMSSAMSGFSSSLASQPLLANDQAVHFAAELGEPEFGEWNWMVLDPKGVTLRQTPTYASSSKLKVKVNEGEVVRVVEKRIGAGTTFLRLESPDGWAFDVQPGSTNKRQRLVEVMVECGQWYYRVRALGCQLHTRCIFSRNDALLGQPVPQGEIITVHRRVRLGSGIFLEVSGGGWAFDAQAENSAVEGPLDLQEHSGGEDSFALVVCQGGINLHSAPTKRKDARTAMMLLQGATVQLRLSGWVDSCWWAKVCQPGGMEGWLPMQALQVHESHARTHVADTSCGNMPFAAGPCPSSGWDLAPVRVIQ